MWIIEFLENENIVKLRTSLNNLNIDYILVEKKNGVYTILDKELLISTDKIINQSFLKDFKSIFLYGSKYFVKEFKEYSFDTDFLDYNNYFELLKEDMLNNDIVIGTLKDLNPKEEVFFIRPLKNNKTINGQVITNEEFLKLKESFYLTEPCIYDNELFLVSSIKDIKEEYRFFILDKKIIGMSSYSPNRELLISNDLIRYVEQKMKQIPIDAYVIDIAINQDDSYKIIEFNNINASGIYNIDLNVFIKEINKYLNH